MIFQYTHEKVLNQTKTSTTRPVKAGGIARRRWQIGKTYAIQPGRGLPSVGRIRLTSFEYCNDPFDRAKSDPAYLRAEGFDKYEEFAAIWRKMHGDEPTPSWVIGFELVK